MGRGYQTKHERYLAEWCHKKPVFIDYPKEIKSFYMKQNADGKTVAAQQICWCPGIGELDRRSQLKDCGKLAAPHGRAGHGQDQLRVVHRTCVRSAA